MEMGSTTHIVPPALRIFPIGNTEDGLVPRIIAVMEEKSKIRNEGHCFDTSGR